ncbi:alpha/beta hydrolase fold protein [Penicillium manginii]|uniref:alpha/beta hydrolase fold protein n=1 Tax=Penicillium manginii TaxID=203109 RepID=UPI0025478AAA|nr:alpha/beta hydrolase fold protein [Penicillium manginii]KAJ5744754.1 alpha/beta hydrolase fold protein [Penicillium manginii]
MPPRNWTVETGSSLISIGSHRLWVSVSGPPRNNPEAPLVVVIAGAGDVASSYTALSPLVSSSSRILLYDRSGLGRSESSPCPSTSPTSPTPSSDSPDHHSPQISRSRSPAVTAAEELHSLLETMRLEPPLVLLAHSYGAIIAREYLHLYDRDVAGLVLADGSTERQCDYLRLPDPDIDAVLGDLRVAQVTGLRTEARLSRDEWRERAIDISRGAVAAQVEANSHTLNVVCRTLGAKRQFQNRAMRDRPVSVIRCSIQDFERIYEAGIEAGNGTIEQRQAFRRLLDRLPVIDQDAKEEQLQLSSNTHLVYLSGCGHNVHLTRPDVVAAEIQWVLEHIDQWQGLERDELKL